ncbi:MAG: diguanylate cyclase domain-containing protein [Emergencia sp.]
MEFKLTIILISVIIAMMDVVLAKLSFAKNKKEGKYLGWACILAALVDLSYLLSIFTENYLLYSCLTSLYFISIDLMLNVLVSFVYLFTKLPRDAVQRGVIKAFRIYLAIDIMLLASNPWTNVCIEYIPRDTMLAKYEYAMEIPYYCHLAYAYILLGFVFLLLIDKSRKVPHEYRRPYLINVLSMIVVLLINAGFLFLDSTSLIGLLDVSIWCYSIVALSLYWSCFEYAKKGMMIYFKGSIFDNVDQGLILFDYDNNLILNNEKAKNMFPDVQMNDKLSLESFIKQGGISLAITEDIEGEANSIQIYHKTDGKEVPLRCDYRRIMNKQNKLLGRLFVFSDMSMESDWLTGFQNWDSFCSMVRNPKYAHTYPLTVAACDITALSVYNASKGIAAGDQLIKHLAALLRERFSKGSYYVRGDDALLIVLDYYGDEEQTREKLKAIQREFEAGMQYSVITATEEQPDILEAIQKAKDSVSAKKLLDKDSRHSAVLNSLMQTLRETNVCTEAHVRRTQLMANRLGERLGLSDLEQSQLSLLCMLHDIGKIGIPIEILNKPGRLTEEEWDVIRTHPEKGYQIAMSAPELNGIAEMIKYHHEYWDGSGYPDGLSRESIPLLSRIIAVLDAYDAMVNDRPYRKALSTETALAELRHHAGIQFDPAIVAEFIRMIGLEDFECMKSAAAKSTSEGVETGSEGSKDSAWWDTEILSEPEDLEESATVFPVRFAKYYLDESMHIIDCNRQFEELTGYTLEYVKENALSQIDLLPPASRTEYMSIVNAQLAKEDICYLEHGLITLDGKEINVLCLGRRYFDYAVNDIRSELLVVKSSSTHLARLIAAQEERKAMHRLERWESTYRCDSLTGLLQHAPFKNDVEQHLLDNKYRIMMLMIDIDLFKIYNDTYGHQEGDNLLVFLAKTLEESLSPSDLACRMGGDEFAAALFFEPDQSEEVMYNRAREIFEKLHVTLHALNPCISVSVGTAISDSSSTFNSLYKKSDEALYKAKNNGRDRIEF